MYVILIHLNIININNIINIKYIQIIIQYKTNIIIFKK